MNAKQILNSHSQSLALVIGNGINRFNNDDAGNSWWHLLSELANRHLEPRLRDIPKGISLVEFYDLVELGRTDRDSSTLKTEISDLISEWEPQEHHDWVVGWAMSKRRPILTTNYDFNLNNAVDAQLFHGGKHGFTDFYPWESYFAFNQVEDPASEFAIWHVNGTCLYKRSIRLGLSDYMGAVERARRWIHRGKEERLFSGKDVRRWTGSKSWLHVAFNCDLLIVGLELGPAEVFLRWLLIERAKYFRQFPDRKRAGWYIQLESSREQAKDYFLRGVGIEPIQVSAYSEIWGLPQWTP